MTTEILLDYDGVNRRQLLQLIRTRWRYVFRFIWPKIGRLRFKSADVKKTHHGAHIRLYVRNKILPRELIILQFALGSDFRRECLNFRRVAGPRQIKSWNVLYQYKFNSRYEATSVEIPDLRLSAQIPLLVEQFWRHKK